MRRSPLVLRLLFAALLLLQGGVGAQRIAPRASAPSLLQLEVSINGVDSEKIGAFEQRGDRLFARAGELRELGIAVPVTIANEQKIDLSTLSKLKFVVDHKDQTISFVTAIEALATHRLDPHRAGAPVVQPSPPGLLVNYDVTATSNHGSLDTYGLFSARLFGRFGTFQADATVTRSRSGTRFVRLGTTYSFSEPDRLRTWSLGDVISGSLPDTRSVRLGGVQLASNFALRPDLITYPLPIVSGGAAVPSTVDVLVNGVRQLSAPVAPGPFYVPQLPVVSGAGQISVAVRDAAGRQTIQTSSFYTSSALLSPGLASFSLEAGAVRHDFGVESEKYGPFAASATGRRGVSDTVTIEGHAEAAGRLGLLRGGATVEIGHAIVASGAVTASTSRGGTGYQAYLAIERTAPRYHLGVSMLAATRDYRDIGSLAGDPPPSHVIQANGGVSFGRQGSLGIAYTDVSQRGVSGSQGTFSLFGSSTAYLRPAIHTALASATYSRELFGRAYAYATGYQDVRDHHGAVMFGLSLRFGGRGAVNASYESRSRQTTAEASRPALDPGDLGYRVYGATGASDHELAELRYRGTHGELGVGVDHFAGNTYLQANARGSIVAMSGGVFTANTVSDGFAVVDAQGLRDVDVTLNNRPVGRTDRTGRLFVPGLVSYQPNVIAIDPTRLPIDAQWSSLEDIIAPGDRAGAVARFGLARRHPVLIVLRRSDGSLLPVGSRVTLEGRETQQESGFDGQVYFDDLVGTHRLVAVSPDGSRCLATITGAAATPGMPVTFRCLPMLPQLADGEAGAPPH